MPVTSAAPPQYKMLLTTGNAKGLMMIRNLKVLNERLLLRERQPKIWTLQPQRVHVGIWYILRAQRGSHIPTLRPKYILYTYIDPLGTLSEALSLLALRQGDCFPSSRNPSHSLLSGQAKVDEYKTLRVQGPK